MGEFNAVEGGILREKGQLFRLDVITHKVQNDTHPLELII